MSNLLKYAPPKRFTGTVYGAGYASATILGGTVTNTTSITQYGTPTYKDLGVGQNHIMMIRRSDNTLWGSAGIFSSAGNEYGQLGLGYTSFTEIPLLQVNNGSWREIRCSLNSSFAIAMDGTLWACGWNSFGQLGFGNTTDVYSFTQVGTDSDWLSVHPANNATFAIKNDGTLWFAGDSFAIGSAGINTTTFTKIGSSTWTKISGGQGFAVGIRTNGTLWAVGANGVGQLGLGDTTARTAFTQVTVGSVYKDVSCGYLNTLAIKTNGLLCGCGSNSYGQLGFGDTTQRTTLTVNGANSWDKVSCSRGVNANTMVIRSNGLLFGCGFNGFGNLGINSGTTNITNLTQVNNSLKYGQAKSGYVTMIALRS